MRVEQIGDATLYLADCRDVLPTLGRVDAVVTDPPYGVDFRGLDWDTDIPDWHAAAMRVSPVVVFTTAPTTMWDYPRPDWVANWYRPASSSRAVGGGFNHWSPILVYGGVKLPVDAINLHAIAHAYPPGFPHPSPKPEALMEWLVAHASQEGDTVCDPFCGSGTTAVACANLGRRFIGIEIEPAYFDTACRRIEQAYRQPRLFAEPAPRPEQMALIA